MFAFRQAATAIACAALVLSVAPATAGPSKSKSYAVHNLVSNGVVPTDFFDANLQNTWGVAFNPEGLVWVTNNRTGTSTLYDGTGLPNPLVVAVPPATSSGVGSPIGIVFSGSEDFVVGNGTTTGPSRFIFSSEDGLISGWAPNVDLNNAIRVVATPGARYKGLATAIASTGARLYATDFAHGRVDMFDAAFRKIARAGAFVDPSLPARLMPFGIQAIGSEVYVTFVRQENNVVGGQPDGGDAAATDSGRPAQEDKGGGADSVVDVFDTDGKFLRRAAADIGLKQPWGIAVAPAGFGKYGGRLLIGDFHDGTISAYDRKTGRFLGYLNGAGGQPLKMPGLWGMQFGNGLNEQPLDTLFFGAGPNGEGGGVYGSVTATAN